MAQRRFLEPLSKPGRGVASGLAGWDGDALDNIKLDKQLATNRTTPPPASSLAQASADWTRVLESLRLESDAAALLHGWDDPDMTGSLGESTLSHP